MYPNETRKYCWQVKNAEHRLRHKLFPANASMKFFHCTLRPIGTVAAVWLAASTVPTRTFYST